MNMEKIINVWFTAERIYIRTDADKIYSLPLEVFPILKEASGAQREDFTIEMGGEALRWKALDEDIHISSFFEPETVNYDNEVNRLLSQFPYLDMKAFAAYLGMHWTKLARFRYGVWTPTAETLEKIKNGIKKIGNEMAAATF